MFLFPEFFIKKVINFCNNFFGIANYISTPAKSLITVKYGDTKRRNAIMASRSNNRNTGFENMKYEIASQVGVNLKEGYNGDLTSRDAGKVGGNITKKVFQTLRDQHQEMNK